MEIQNGFEVGGPIITPHFHTPYTTFFFFCGQNFSRTFFSSFGDPKALLFKNQNSNTPTMPKRQRSSTKERKSSYKTKKVRRSTVVNLADNGVPSTIKAKLRYSESISLTPSAGAITGSIFQLNSLYDPDYTGTGHQPYTFDQRIAMHDHYTVIGGRVSITFLPTGNHYFCGLNIRDQNTAITDSKYFFETPRSQARLMSASATDPITLHASWKGSDFFGTSTFIGKDPYRGTVSASPLEGIFAGVYVGSFDGFSTTGTVSAIVRITFDSVFTEPRLLALS